MRLKTRSPELISGISRLAVNSTKNFKLSNVKLLEKKNTNLNEKMYFILISWLISVHIEIKNRTDILINTIPLIFNNMFNYDIKKSKFQLFGITIYMIYTYIYSGYITIETGIELSNGVYEKADFAKQILDILMWGNPIDIVPIETHISYFIVNLQKIYVDSEIISKCRKHLIFGIMQWVIFNREEQIEIQKLFLILYKIFDPESTHYKFDGIDDLTSEEIERVKNILEEKNSVINIELFEKL